jgi:hypothetical protein
LFNAQKAGCFSYLPLYFPLGNPAHLKPEAQVLRDRHMRIKGVALKHHGHVPFARREWVNRLAVK